MPEDVEWAFYGYVSPAGNQIVQDWYDGLDEDAKDSIRDALAYLQMVPIALWRKPDFEHFEDGISEVRAKAHVLKKVYRFYGFFWPEGRRYVYTFLLGDDKKVWNPRSDVDEARKRKGRVQRGEATIHEFDFTK